MAKRAMAKYDLKSVWFTEKEKKEYQLFLEDNRTDLLDLLLEIQENGFKISISQDNGNGSPLVSISVKPKTTKQTGTVFMYRHNDLEKCIRIAHYHFTVVIAFGENLMSDEDTLDW